MSFRRIRVYSSQLMVLSPLLIVVQYMCNQAISSLDLSCRESAIRAVTLFVDHVPDLTPHLAHLFPVVMARGVPVGSLYDAELQLFIHDTEEHDAYKRCAP